MTTLQLESTVSLISITPDSIGLERIPWKWFCQNICQLILGVDVLWFNNPFLIFLAAERKPTASALSGRVQDQATRRPILTSEVQNLRGR